MHAILLEKTLIDSTFWFLRIFHLGFTNLLSSGGLDFLSIVFIEGIFLLGEHL